MTTHGRGFGRVRPPTPMSSRSRTKTLADLTAARRAVTTMLRTQPFGDESAKLLVEPSVLDILGRYRQLTPDALEAGGILLGFRRGAHLHVSDATVPQPSDVRHRFSFHRRASNHQAIARKRWSLSNRTMDYLGEWHTHPEDMPAPSRIDLRNWESILTEKGQPMVFLIIGICQTWVGLGAQKQIRVVLDSGL